MRPKTDQPHCVTRGLGWLPGPRTTKVQAGTITYILDNGAKPDDGAKTCRVVSALRGETKRLVLPPHSWAETIYRDAHQLALTSDIAHSKVSQNNP